MKVVVTVDDMTWFVVLATVDFVWRLWTMLYREAYHPIWERNDYENGLDVNAPWM